MEYKIPLFDLNYGIEEENAALETIRSRWISSGPKCNELEQMFCSLLDVKYARAVTNCTAALHLAMLALEIGKGDEVIVPSLTFVATVNAVRYTGAEPVFCDVTGLDDLTIDPIEIEKLISDRTKAIVVMHYAGFPCNMERILEIAQKHNLKIIEDACHGPMSEYGGKKLGTIGDLGCFSFFSNKNISTGEGGIIVTNHKDYDDKIKLLRSHGMTTLSYERAKGHSTDYDVLELGYNYRMDDIRASIAIVQLNKLETDLHKRELTRRLYINELKSEEKIIVPFINMIEFSSNYIMPVVIKNSTFEIRNRIREFMHIKGIQTSVHYPAAHRFSIYKEVKRGNLNNTEYITDCEITLPMHSSLKEEDVFFICDTLKEAVK